jgi:hypothetical protein
VVSILFRCSSSSALEKLTTANNPLLPKDQSRITSADHFKVLQGVFFFWNITVLLMSSADAAKECLVLVNCKI